MKRIACTLLLAGGLAWAAPVAAHPIDPDPRVVVETTRPMPVIVESTRPREGAKWSELWLWLQWAWCHLYG